MYRNVRKRGHVAMFIARSVVLPSLIRHARACGSATAKFRFKDVVRPELVEALRKTNIFTPNAVQAEALRHAVAGEDLIVCAQTGSGKTLLFLLPILQKLSEHAPPPLSFWSRKRQGRHSATRHDDDEEDEDEQANRKQRRKGPRDRILAQPEALILVPTRELAVQIAAIAERLAVELVDGQSAQEANPVSVLTLSNGQRFTPEREALRRDGGARLVIATPARLLYHLGEDSLSLRRLRQVAIDEADAVLCGADGVQREGVEVLRQLKKVRSRFFGHTVERQYLLTAATIGAEHDAAIRDLFPSVRRVSHAGVLVPTLRQVYHYVRSDKDQELLQLLEKSEVTPFLHDGATLIFCGSVRRASRVHELLASCMPELRPELVHGETRPAARELALRKFHEDETRFLVCSDVATRGLDFPGVRHVIMYDMPRDVTAFIHRAGRTARRGQPGLLTCLVKPFEQSFYNQLRLGEAVGSPLHQTSGREGHEGASKSTSPLALQSPEQRRTRWSSHSKQKALGTLEWKARQKTAPTTPSDTEPPVIEFAP